MRRCGRCALVAGVLALLLGPLLMLFAKGSIDSGLRDEATAALAAKGVSAVSASSNWAALTLTGPASAQSAALAAVAGIADRPAVDTVTYRADDSGAGSGTTAASPTPDASAQPSDQSSPSAAAAAPVAVHAEVSGAGDPHTLTLSGTVQTQAQHQALVDAATAAYGAGNVKDTITVVGDASRSGSDDAAVAQLAGVLKAFGPSVASGSADLADTTLTVTATAKDAATATTANAALEAAKGGGLTVTGAVQPPAAPASLTAQQVSDQIAKILAVRGVTFDTGSATLTPAGAATLAQVDAVLVKAPAVKILVAGHTDNQGAPASNQALSIARTATVKAYLIAHQVAGDRISTAAFGATRPIASNDTAAGRSANRRIDLTVVGS